MTFGYFLLACALFPIGLICVGLLIKAVVGRGWW